MEFRNTKTCNLSQELKRQHAEREKAEAKLERQRRNQMRKQLKRINQQQKAVKRAQSTIYRASTYGKGKRRKSSASRLGKLGGVSHKSKSVRSAKERLKFS